MIIDSHQHFWKYDRDRHSWIDDTMAAIRKDFLPDDLSKVYADHGIDGCIAVQADQTREETSFLCDLSKKYPFIKGVVGWVDLRYPDIHAMLEYWSDHKVIRGFRHIVQGEADHNFMLRKSFLDGIRALKNYDYTYDILIFPHQLTAAIELAHMFPNQKFVVDHIAKPYIKDGYFHGWAMMMKHLASYPNVYCKLSGIITEADYQSWDHKQINPYIDWVLECFGSDRLMFGSDWPVCLVAGSYGDVLDIVQDRISQLSEDEQDKIMATNSIEFYNIEI